MNVLIVYAHPEPRSLNGALKDFTVQRLRTAGHAVQLSDLYAMGWKAPSTPETAWITTWKAASIPRRIRAVRSPAAGRARTSPPSRTNCAGPMR